LLSFIFGLFSLKKVKTTSKMARAGRPKRANNKKKFNNNNLIQVNNKRQEANPNFILKRLFEKCWYVI